MVVNKKILLIFGIIVGLLLIGGGILLWAVWRSTPEAIDSSGKSTRTTTQYENQQELVDEVNKKYGNDDYQGAISLIEGQKNNQDVRLQLLLAGAYANSGDIKKAFEIYQKVDNDGKLPKEELVNLASMAERAGDKQAAISAYKRAKEYAMGSTSVSEDEIAMYASKITELEKR